MSSREILQLGNSILWEKSARIDDHLSASTISLARDLSDTLASFREMNGFGRGIAAPQIGILKRMIFIRMQLTGFCGAIINPEIEWNSKDIIELWDDCFSLPNLIVRVRRFARIRVAYEDERGAKQALEAEGDLSELLQHEIDHLDGLLATDRVISPHAIATREEWERQNKK